MIVVLFTLSIVLTYNMKLLEMIVEELPPYESVDNPENHQRDEVKEGGAYDVVGGAPPALDRWLALGPPHAVNKVRYYYALHEQYGAVENFEIR